MTAKSPPMPSDWVDPDDAPELTAEFFDQAIPMIGERQISQAEFAQAAQEAQRRGRPSQGQHKHLVSIRYDPEVIAYFKATGPGWQTRMNNALKDWIRRQAA